MRHLLLPVSVSKKNHVCQILYELKEEYGDIFDWESDDNCWPGNAKANENDPVAWQVGAWTLDPWCVLPTPLVVLS